MNFADGEVVSFGPFRLSAAMRQVERAGVPLALGHRALDILIVLVERAGEVVGQRELNARVWRDLVVGPGNLRVHMSALRKALGDGEGGARYIENVTGQGYCFVAAVTRENTDRSLARPREFPEVARRRMVLPSRLARMVGRDDVVRSIGAELIGERFVTIIGPGGMGKTTVAIAVAHQLREEFDGAVCLIDVGAVADPELVAITVASSLGLAVQTDALQTLVDYLRPLRILLLLDSCEHVVDAIAALAETIYKETAGVHILATSREALRVEGEHAYWLPALPSPPPETSLKADNVRSFAAVKLFMERAAASGGRFELDDQTAPLVAGICGRLDGMALAIELAAGRAGSYGIAATAELLNKNLGLDWHGRRTALPRHQTLRALIDWSYGLLVEANQRALRHLSVLVGSFDAAAAGAIVFGERTCESATLDMLDSLVSKSLVSVQTDDDGTARFRVLETTRIYARAKLEESGEGETAARRHATHFAQLLHARHGGHIDLEYTGRAHALREHLGNVRAALDWCFARGGKHIDPVLAVDLAAAAAPMFFELSMLSEANVWSEAGLAALDASTRGGRRELILESTWAISSMWTRGSDDVLAAVERAMQIAHPLDEPAQRLRLQATRHMVLTRKADFHGALEAAVEWDVAARQTADVTCLAISDLLLGQARHYLGDQASATRHFEAGFALAGERHLQLCGMDQRMRGLVAWSRVLWLTGFPERAVQAARDALECAVGSGKPLNTVFALLFAAPMYLWRRDWDNTQKLLDEVMSHSHWEVLGPFHAVAQAMQAATLIGRGEPGRGMELMLPLGEKMGEECMAFMGTCVACFMAEGHIALGRAGDALMVVRNARRRALRGGEQAVLPELLRVQAEALLALSPANEVRAVRLLDRSCRIARRQAALSWELRSALARARIDARRGEFDAALRRLAPVHGRFTEGFGTQDLLDAGRFLRETEQAQGAVTSDHVSHGETTGESRTSPLTGIDSKSQTSSSPN